MTDTIDFGQAMSYSDSAPSEWTPSFSDLDTSGDTSQLTTTNWNPNSDPGYDAYNPAPIDSPADADGAATPTESWIDAGGLLGQIKQSPADADLINRERTIANQRADGNGSSNKESSIFNDLAKALGPQGVAALITASSGMLAGASQGKQLEAKWAKEKEMRDQEWARKDRNSYAGAVSKKSWAQPKTGLLGAVIK